MGHATRSWAIRDFAAYLRAQEAWGADGLLIISVPLNDITADSYGDCSGSSLRIVLRGRLRMIRAT